MKIINNSIAFSIKVLCILIFYFLSLKIVLAQATYCPATPPNVPGTCASQFGYQSHARGAYSFASGYQAIAYGSYAVAIGQQCYSSTSGYSFGNIAKASADNTFAIGRNVQTNGINSIIIGASLNPAYPLTNSYPNCIMMGINVTEPTLTIKGPENVNSGFGKVGIGTSSPLYNLHILSNTGENALLYVQTKQFTGSAYAALLLGNQSHGITADPTNGLMFKTQKYYVFNDGNLGVGTSNPLVKLQVNGSVSIGYESTLPEKAQSLIVSGLVGIGTASPLYKLEVQGDALDEWISKFSNRNMYRNGIMIQAGYSPNATVVLSLCNNDNKAVFNALSNGKVIIGNYNNTPDDYSLFVEKGIWTQKVKVDLKTSWPDYVFNDDYVLMSMDELKQFIISNKHLPDIPKEDQLKREGLDLGEMNTLLVKKLEELTLYLINQNDRIKYLEEKLGMNNK